MSAELSLTAKLRTASVWAWALGLGLLAFDFFSLPVFRWRASAAYILFGLAAAAVAWAEKREFSSRVFIYRLHDAVIYTPWKYLLLYFLWVSVYSPFTEFPLASLVYATNGWMSLFLIGLSAQFIFCERTVRGAFLLPARLSIAFWVYALTLSILMANTLLHIFFPSLPLSPLAAEQANLFLYFLMGLPFLLWDFVKDGRRLLPRALSLFTIWSGTITVMLIGRRLYHVALALILGGVLGFFLFKKLRPHKPLLLGIGAAVCAVAMAAGLAYFLRSVAPWEASLDNARIAAEGRVRATIIPAWEALRQSHFLGLGVGVTEMRGVWKRVIAEAGVVGAIFYSGFFLALLWDLYRVRHSQRVVVSNIAFLSVGVFLVLLSHFVENPYGAYIWVWYALWALFAATPKKKGSVSA
jgi:hypothetical protein